MAKESAMDFTKKVFEDDEFARKVFTKTWYMKMETKEEGTNADNKRMVEAGKSMGYNFTLEEYEQASNDYIESIGGFKTLKVVFHAIKLQAKVENELENGE